MTAHETSDRENKESWWSRLKQGLKKSSDKIEDGLKTIFVRRKLDQDMLLELEDLLLTTDMGVATVSKIIEHLASQKMNREISIEEVKTVLCAAVAEILKPVAQPLCLDSSASPHVILVVGVNGSGKTTTIGKLGKIWKAQGLSVEIAAGDTFRAAAVEQLQIWGERLEIPVITAPLHSDAAALAYQALERAKKNKTDILIIDTAGRLHNKSHLMEELQKIRRVLQKIDETAPQTTLLVLDATTGQNAHQQVRVFKEIIGITGLIMTKLDGTARGGVVVGLAEKFALPIHALGVGEKADDLKPFDAIEFANHLMGLESLPPSHES